MDDVEQVINRLNLSPHPEGGHYRECYRSEQDVWLPNDEKRSAGTGIYFLLAEGELSNWHRVRWDEGWHFYDGDPLMLEIIDRDGSLKRLALGNTFAKEVAFQRLVPQNCWQRAYCTGRYSLVGCTVSPGFEFEDFEMIEPKKLAQEYPDIADDILKSPV
ncbi:cupin domain-containing protein [Fodinibius sp. Rm-B-1B1-1]|uniref:cupin domain-containing protein n=1 Tax=Fodinibius alkaliphilus TaxID=3140241 RepID=UPI00315A6131